NCDRQWIPVKRSWRLNERHYGALQGKDKAQTLTQYGEAQFKIWRRSFDVPPPAIEDGDKYSQANDPRYVDLGNDLPRTECLKDVVTRLLPYLNSEITNDLNAGKLVLVAAHGNSIRAIVKHIDCISDEDIAEVNIPTGIPLLYEFDDDFEPIKKGGRYLDPVAAQKSIAAVENQGKK
ncbi:MAG: 2,3-bisphosphoglycerate-dependent phosphoglycerate mutase, partial [Actinobacteria bacterium]|nr:2,3-bisphosphoglycerate-dependent phosphoglycerate mutase [Actinomycetota bacterium]